MAENTTGAEGALGEDPEKKHSDEDVAKIVKGRLKNLNLTNQELQDTIARLQTEKEQREVAAAPAPDTPSPSLNTQGVPAAPTPAPGASEINQTGDPLTAESMQNMLNAQQQQGAEQAQQLQVQQAHAYHVQNVRKMLNEDEKFKKLEEKSPFQIPPTVAVHLSNNLDHGQAKKLFSELMSNETSFLKMKNAFLESPQAYHDWVTKKMGSTSDQKTPPAPIPELGQEGNASAGSGNDDGNIQDYLKSL